MSTTKESDDFQGNFYEGWGGGQAISHSTHSMMLCTDKEIASAGSSAITFADATV